MSLVLFNKKGTIALFLSLFKSGPVMSKATYRETERRIEPRLTGLFPLWLRAQTTSGQAIAAYTVTDNICSTGVYFQWPYTLAIGQRVFMLIHLANGVRIAVRGEILRQESRPHHLMGIAVRFIKTRAIARPGAE